MENLVSGAMAKFRCLGGACEDTCCAGWVVPLDRASHRRLLVLAEHHPTAKRMLTESVRFVDGEDEGHLEFNEEGFCGMLTQDGSCAIHAELGPEALFEVCATYPRYASHFGSRYEHFGALSCPEVVRLSLFEDGGLELELSELPLPRRLRNDVALQGSYAAPFDHIRETLSGVHAHAEEPLGERHFRALYISEKVSEFIYKGGPTFPEEALRELFSAFGSEALHGALRDHFRQLPADDPSALNIVTQVLFSPRTNEPSRAKYFEQRERLLEHFSLKGKTLPLSDSELSQLASALREASKDSATEMTLSRVLGRYALHFVHVTPYLSRDNPLLYSLELTLRVASLFVFLMGMLMLADPQDAAERDAVLVEGIYSFSRYHEHSDVFSRLVTALHAAGRANLATGVGLAKLISV